MTHFFEIAQDSPRLYTAKTIIYEITSYETRRGVELFKKMLVSSIQYFYKSNNDSIYVQYFYEG